jgi:hypothetical protein
MCRATPSPTAYVLVEHSPTTIARNAREKLVRRLLQTYPMPLCAACTAKVRSALDRRKAIAIAALGGIGIACLYFVAAIVRAPTAVAIALLFGGFGLFAASGVALVLQQKRIVAWLPIAENRGNNVAFFTTSYEDLETELSRLRTANAEIKNELERPRDAAKLPVAKIRD